MTDVLFSALFIIITAVSGYLLRFLTISGMWAAIFVGLIVFFSLGIDGLLLMGLFFVSSSIWSKYKRRQKNKIEEMHAKGSQRDVQQVFANGGMAAIACLIYIATKDSLWILVYCSAIACSNSDTWASEIGSLSKDEPVYVRNFKKVSPGTSGAISFIGTLAAIIGSFFIAVVAYFLFHLSFSNMLSILLFGFLGNVIDTLFGAFFQVQYICSQCGLVTEKSLHCGEPTKVKTGYVLFNNDMVNFLSSCSSALFTFIFYQIS
ncbi:DUF92 domain-containing protein [Cytobacillus sp. Hz8]|uniref:DUF92 domain-containing protein n=1 Tax=Cytobacillus sp. Hz8 TaxID=3347168 RepID=UPI0035D8B33F